MQLSDIEELAVDGVDRKDHPDFSDAHFSDARWKKSRALLTEAELNQLTEEFPDLLNEMAHESLN